MKKRIQTTSKYPVKSLTKALMILEKLGEKTNGASITELGRDLKIGKSTVHRLLATLKDGGYVMVEPITSRYTLGSMIARLAEQLTHQSPLLSAGVPAIQRLAHECNETANLAVLEGQDVLYLAKQESKEPLRMSGQVGKRLPAYCTALGKALLADLPERQIRKLYGSTGRLRTVTPHTISNLSDLVKELEEIHREGISYDQEEMYVGVQCVATPVRDYSGKTIAAISISAPKHRMTSDKLHHFKEQLLREGAHLSAALGHVMTKPKTIK